MTHTLVTILGKSRESKNTGYRQTTYRFPDGKEEQTAFFGLALSQYLEPDATVILGTSGSQWDVLVEHLATDGDDEARLALMEAVENQAVTQCLLDQVTPLLTQAMGCDVLPRLIPFGRTAKDQYAILNAIADAVPNGAVSFDLTHGFRHLGMIGFLSAFTLERFRNLSVRDLWYGALDMTQNGVTPVLQLDGLVRVRRWVDALDRFDATGDYGVFSPLLIDDGVPADKASCLKDAAFLERTLNVSDAARKIGTFRPVLDTQLAGASGLFQRRLTERLRWVEADRLSEQQWELAYQYLNRGDFVRAAMFGREACVTRVCEDYGVPGIEFGEGRQNALDQFEEKLKGSKRPKAKAYRTLKRIRNALAHGTRPPQKLIQTALKDPQKLDNELRKCLDRFFERRQGCGLGAIQ